MPFPTHRLRRLRQSESLRALVRETDLLTSHLILPLFITHGARGKYEIASMPGQYRYTLPELLKETREVVKLKIPAVILFGLPKTKDETGSEAIHPRGIVQTAIRAIKDQHPDLLVITDVCIDEYTTHGHCGILVNQKIDNDATLAVLEKMALSHAEAGADIVAPSDMMDGRVGRIRRALDAHGYTHLPILSYAVKYASSFYGPFRDAVNTRLQFGDRKSHQMDIANHREALREAELDLEEGADILMVKPALPYLDVIFDLKQRYPVPIAAYQVSGEYAMIKAAAQKGWLDEQQAMMESLTAIRRAGADMILTYFAKQVAQQQR